MDDFKGEKESLWADDAVIDLNKRSGEVDSGKHENAETVG